MAKSVSALFTKTEKPDLHPCLQVQYLIVLKSILERTHIYEDRCWINLVD